eukprot:UN05037
MTNSQVSFKTHFQVMNSLNLSEIHHLKSKRQTDRLQNA